jgi:uncharacterized protein YggE
MKKISIIILLVSITLAGMAQSVDLHRKIEVNGTAEQEVTPDIINVSISLKEYLDGKNKVTISQLEQQLETAVSEAGIPKADFTINNLSSYNYVYQKKKNPDFLASKQYLIRFHDLNRFNQIMSKIDPKGILSTNIDSYDYSKLPELKREMKIQALMAAKEKATYLLNSLGEKLGGAIEIVDNEENGGFQAQPMYANRVLMAKSSGADAPESDIDVKKIKLSFSVHVVFEIGK